MGSHGALSGLLLQLIEEFLSLGLVMESTEPLSWPMVILNAGLDKVWMLFVANIRVAHKILALRKEAIVSILNGVDTTAVDKLRAEKRG